MKKASLVVVAFLSAFTTFAQLYDEDETSRVNIGLGIGQGYGGLGARLSLLPAKFVSIFGGVGYNLHKAGFNIGGSFKLLPDKRVTPTLIGMYGYNAVIVVFGKEEYNKTYYGPSFGAGLELHLKSRQDFFNFELIIPVRSQQYRDDLDKVQNDPDVQLGTPLPFTIGFGYHFAF